MAEQEAQRDRAQADREPLRRGKNVRGLRTRQELLVAARACFSEYGYARTRIADIVFGAGVSQGNFYRHFHSKDEIFVEALRPSLDDLAASTGRAHIGDGADLETMVALSIAFFTSYARNRQILRVMRQAAAVNAEEEAAELWLRQRAIFVDQTTRWLQRLHTQGRIATTDFGLLADVLGSTIEQTAYVHIGLPAEAPRPERIRELAAVVGRIWHRSLPLIEGAREMPAV